MFSFSFSFSFSFFFLIVVFDPHARQILRRDPQEIKKWQDEGNIAELEAMTAAVEGKQFLVDLWLGQGGWAAKDFVEPDNDEQHKSN